MGDVKLNSSGGGSVTLTPPNTASNYTVTLPAATSTLIDTTSTQTLTNKTIASLVTTGTATFGGIVDTGSTGQVKFPAIQNPSSDANTLDDYEEGTWTPVITFGGGSVGMTYGQQNGNYTKIGNFVIARAYITLTIKGSSTGTALLTGLPFTSKTVTAGYAIAKAYFNGMTGLSGADTCYLPPAATFLQLTYGGTGAIAGITSSNYANGSDNIFTICYQTD